MNKMEAPFFLNGFFKNLNAVLQYAGFNIDPTNNKIKTKISKDLAYFHEVGHAVVAHMMGCNVEEINMNVGKSEFPAVKVSSESFGRLKIDDQIKFYMAGYAAEESYRDTFVTDTSPFKSKDVNEAFDGVEDRAEFDIAAAKKLCGEDQSKIMDAKNLVVILINENREKFVRVFFKLGKQGIINREEFLTSYNNK